MADYKSIVKRLDELADEITPVLLEEADPKNWSGAGKKIADMDKGERGDRFWDKKNASSTAALLVKIHAVIELTENASKGRARRDGARIEIEELADELARAEREAKQIMTRIAKH